MIRTITKITINSGIPMPNICSPSVPYVKYKEASSTGGPEMLWRKCMGIEPTADVFSARHWI
jgi:hypothetical protein